MNNYYIFNIGNGRCGTGSLTKALNILGIPTIHYETEDKHVIENRVVYNLNAGQQLLRPLDQKYRGFSDFGGEHYFKKLYAQYPNSKFIYTDRYFPDYLRSFVALKITGEPNQFKQGMAERWILYYTYIYFERKNEILDFFKDKSDQFLHIDIPSGDGWDKLCPFLDLEIPDIDFPYQHKNSDIGGKPFTWTYTWEDNKFGLGGKQPRPASSDGIVRK